MWPWKIFKEVKKSILEPITPFFEYYDSLEESIKSLLNRTHKQLQCATKIGTLVAANQLNFNIGQMNK